MPLHVAFLPSNGTCYCPLFLLQWKHVGSQPTVSITDGWDASVTAIAWVCPHAQHLFCRFHALHAALRRRKAARPEWSARRAWGTTLRYVFRTADTRTVRRRLEKLHAQVIGTPMAAVIARLLGTLPTLLPAVGSTFRPTTSNAVEHFFAAFARFSRLKGPLHSKASAEKHLGLCLLGYGLSVRSAEAKADHQGLCPLPQAPATRLGRCRCFL